ncbi:MAG: ceramide glucosyltransferase, partial [Bdellovibrionota bacterium]
MRQIATADPARFKPISILKPLKGTDPGLRENLRSFFEIEYPSFELVFSIADPADPAREIIVEMQRLFPEVRSHLVVGSVEVGANPKVNNLIKSFDLAQHDWVLISDSNVRVNPDYLKRLALQFDENVGVLTAVVRGSHADTFGGRLEATFLNTFYARWMYLAFAFDEPIVLGKSMLLQRSVARRFGGFKTLARYLAEDYMAGEAMQKLGFRIELLDDPVSQPLSGYRFDDFWKRHVRWGRIRKSQAPILFLFEPLLTSIPSGLIGAATLAPWLDLSALGFFALHLFIWYSADQIIERSLAGRR